MMSKRKRFGLSNAMSRGLTETVHIVENATGIFRNAVIPISRIELDPDNPRRLLITRNELVQGPQKSDPNYEQKEMEYEALKGLAKTIQSRGLIQPVAVYKQEDNYRVVAGNRRCMASIIAGKSEIEARIFNEKPKKYELKLVQLIENTAREDLSLYERVNNINDIKHEYENDNQNPLTPELLSSITAYSLTLAKNFLYVINAPKDVLDAIRVGGIQNLDKAALIANIESNALRQEAILACKKGISVKGLREIIASGKNKIFKQKVVKVRGRQATQVNMGTTKHFHVVKLIINSILQQPQFEKLGLYFNDVNWTDYQQTTQAFRQLIKLLETKSVG
jgi:ParB family chromosome partitioning protein